MDILIAPSSMLLESYSTIYILVVGVILFLVRFLLKKFVRPPSRIEIKNDAITYEGSNFIALLIILRYMRKDRK